MIKYADTGEEVKTGLTDMGDDSPIPELVAKATGRVVEIAEEPFDIRPYLSPDKVKEYEQIACSCPQSITEEELDESDYTQVPKEILLHDNV
jgi:hypothetical protein